MMKALALAFFGDNKVQAMRVAQAEENVNTPQPNTRGGTTFGYKFGNVGVQRNPGPAYHSPLQRYSEYIPNVWEGWGGKAVVNAQRKGTQFAAYEPNLVMTYSQPVPTGGSGTVHGQFFGYPLIDTNPNAVG